jgi:hypothetical protein
MPDPDVLRVCARIPPHIDERLRSRYGGDWDAAAILATMTMLPVVRVAGAPPERVRGGAGVRRYADRSANSRRLHLRLRGSAARVVRDVADALGCSHAAAVLGLLVGASTADEPRGEGSS